MNTTSERKMLGQTEHTVLGPNLLNPFDRKVLVAVAGLPGLAGTPGLAGAPGRLLDRCGYPQNDICQLIADQIGCDDFRNVYYSTKFLIGQGLVNAAGVNRTAVAAYAGPKSEGIYCLAEVLQYGAGTRPDLRPFYIKPTGKTPAARIIDCALIAYQSRRDTHVGPVTKTDILDISKPLLDGLTALGNILSPLWSETQKDFWTRHVEKAVDHFHTTISTLTRESVGWIDLVTIGNIVLTDMQLLESLYTTCIEARRKEKLDGPDSFAETVAHNFAATFTNSTQPLIEIVDSPVLESLETLDVEDMPDAVLDGRLGEICQKRLGGLPLAYTYPALVTAAGILVPKYNTGTDDTDDREDTDVFPDPSSSPPPPKTSPLYSNNALRSNLFFCSVGDKGTGKTQGIERAFRCLGMWSEEMDQPAHEKVLVANFGSAEGMLSSEEMGDLQGAKRLVFVDELGHLLEKATIEHSSFPYILNNSFNRTQFLVTMAQRKKVKFNCCLSLFGGVVEDRFGDLFGASTTGGLYDRFMFGLGPKPQKFLYRPFEGGAETVNPRAIDVADDVWEAAGAWTREYSEITPRIVEISLRVAAICAAYDGRTLRAKDLGPTFAFAQYQARVRTVLEPNHGQNPDAKVMNLILKWLRTNAVDGKWVSRRLLAKGIHSERCGLALFDKAISGLVFNQVLETATAGKQKTIRLLV
jgi:hypothetical protein